MTWLILLSVVIIGAIVYGVSLYRHPAPWDQDPDDDLD